MEETQSSDSNIPGIEESKPSIKQENKGLLESGQQAASGNGNKLIQVIHNDNRSCCSSDKENDLLEKRSLPSLEPILGEEIFSDHKYDGRLVSLSLQFYEVVPSEKIRVMITLSFGRLELQIPNQSRFLNSKIDVEFGVKKGDLYFALNNGVMPLQQRNIIKSQTTNWQGNPVGYEVSIWQFGLTEQWNYQNKSQVLSGCANSKEMGIINLVAPGVSCETTVTFKINVNRNCIEVIFLGNEINEKQHNEITKKQRETKIGLLLRYLKNELEDYVSKVIYKV